MKRKKGHRLSVFAIEEFEGDTSAVAFCSYGHHDKQAFIDQMRGYYPCVDTDWKVKPTEETIEHLYYRLVPVLDCDKCYCGMIYHRTKKGHGAFPVTIWDVERLNVEWHLAKTEANQKALAEAQT